MLPEGLNPLEAFLTTSDLWWQVYPGYGFSFFGPEHLIWLAIIVCAITLLLRMYSHMPATLAPKSPRRKTMLWLSLVICICWITVSAMTIQQGVLTVSRLPLYLCNLCELLLIVDTFRLNCFCDECIFAIGLAGGIAALLFPGWSHCPAWSLPSVTGFIEHGCIVCFACMRLLDKDFHPNIRNIWMPIVLTVAYTAAIVPFNIAHGTNFMFVPDPMNAEPLQSIYNAFGAGVYTFIYLVSLSAIYLVEYGIALGVQKRRFLLHH